MIAEQDLRRAVRRAVELAPGWDLVHIYDGEDWAQLYEDTSGVPTQQILIQEPTKYPGSLDALAAALERQFVAGAITSKNTLLWTNYATELRRQPLGTDLTEFRIKYFVEFADQNPLVFADVIESESGPHDWCRGHKSKEYEDRQ